MISGPRILLIDEESQVRALAELVLFGDYPEAEIEQAGTSDDFLGALRADRFDLIVTEIETSWARGAVLLQALGESHPEAAIIVFTKVEHHESVVASMKAGASDYLVKSAGGYLQLRRAAAQAFGKRSLGSRSERSAPGRMRTPGGASGGSGQPSPVRPAPARSARSSGRFPGRAPGRAGSRETDAALRAVEIAVDAMKSGLSDYLDRSSRGFHHLVQSASEALDRAKLEQGWGGGDQLEAFQRRQDALHEKIADLERSNADLREFAYVASHELQEPLRMVEKYGDLLAGDVKGSLNEPARESLDYLLSGTRRMQRMVDDLLEFSRVGTEGAAFGPCDCRELAERAVANLEAAIEESGATVELGNLPTVLGDASQLLHVFQNLLSNAIKFRGDRKPKVSLSAKRDQGHWTILVEDNGIGIEEDDRERIFAIFSRIHPELPGTGIGLAISKRIVERHGGRIWVDATLDRGTRFCFSLPAWDSKGSTEAGPDASTKVSRRRAR